jgi:tetratricopeptide (TPR) repeat protein
MASASQITANPALETRLFWDQYKTTIVSVVAVLVLAGIGYAGYELYTTRRAADASALLTGAKSAHDYEQVIERYPGSAPAASAYLLLAGQQRAGKKYAEANTALHRFIDHFPKHELITTAWMGVAANLESLGKNDEALSTYQRLAAEYPQSFNAPLALLAEIPFLKAKNKNDDVRRICETVLTQYRDSIVANEAMRELTALPKPAGPLKAQPQPSIPMARPPEPPVPAATP